MPSVSDVVSSEFKLKVWQEIETARQRSVETLVDAGIAPAPKNLIPHPLRRGRVSSQRAMGRSGFCVGCGVPYDQATEDCKNCEARHGMRRFDARKKARRSQAA